MTHLTSLLETGHLFYQQQRWLSVSRMQEDHKMLPFERGTSQIAIVLLQAFL
jgi:hypothetical protein